MILGGLPLSAPLMLPVAAYSLAGPG